MKRAIILLVLILALGPIRKAAGQAAPAKPVASAISGNWVIGSIRKADVTPAQVKALLGPDYDYIGVTVCDYAFADIAGDGTYRLVVIDDGGGRFCNNLEIISSDGTVQHIDGWVWGVEKIAEIVVKGDGHEDLRILQTFTDYEGANSCIAVIPIYYQFSEGKFVPATAEHFDAYQALRKKLNSSPPVDVCDEIEADKVDRLLGEKAAGLTHAKTWMESPDPSLRKKAVRVFEDIGNADSEAALKALATDKDPEVAGEAAYAERQ